MIFEFGTLFFGHVGTRNETKLLQRFSMFGRLVEGRASTCNIDINGHQCIKWYYIADGIHDGRHL
jgi:hypothetical protein